MGEKLRLALVGDGRMGQALMALCRQDGEIDARFAGAGDLADADAAVDFSYPGNLPGLLAAAARGMPLVIGTTGYGEAQRRAIGCAAARAPIVWADNFSVGVTVLRRLTRTAAQALGEAYDIEIVEAHHRGKADAPSGTALALARSIDPDGAYPVVFGRQGRTGARGREIGVHALRGGSVAGEHSVRFFGEAEELELRHRADSRAIFARGALHAARFAARAKPGLYGMEDVLFGGHA